MGMDGLSISNTGIIKESTSAELSARTEQAMASDPANSSQQVHNLSNNQMVKQKEESDEQSRKQQERKQPEQFEDGLVEQTEQQELETDIEDLDNPNKEFYVKLNVKDDIIELYDNETDRLIETISGDELGALVQKLNMASGIFVNKKV